MPNLVPSGNGGALTGWLSKASKALVKQPERSIQTATPDQVLVPMPDGTKWTVGDLSRWVHEHNGQLPPHMQPGASGQTNDGRQYHHHEGGNTYHITIAPAANIAEPTKRPKSRKRRAAEGTGRIALWALKALFTQQKQQQQQPQIVYVRHPLSESLVSHLIGFACFIVVIFFAIALIASGPHWYPVPYYAPAHYYDR